MVESMKIKNLKKQVEKNRKIAEKAIKGVSAKVLEKELKEMRKEAGRMYKDALEHNKRLRLSKRG